jgi:signal transduction histidine kinase
MNPDLPFVATLSRWSSMLPVRRIVIVMVLSVAVATLLNPIFVTSFALVLGRTMFVGMALLAAFTAAGHWRQAWLPRWLAQVLAVAFVAPLATFAAYLLAVDFNVAELLHHEGRIAGLLSISLTSLAVGLVTALGALYRERDAQARADSLQFELTRSTLERQALDARLGLLHAQIEPHFLFNTLANVQALVESRSDRAAPVLRHLIAYLRAAMPRLNDADATLASELELLRAYLELMHLRMPDRLQYGIALPAEMGSLRFPSMALLTLVENAVRHGIDPSEDGGRVDVGGARDPASGELRLWVVDTGVGMAETAAQGTGLANLRARLQAFYGSGARLELSDVAPHGLRAELIFEEPRQP